MKYKIYDTSFHYFKTNLIIGLKIFVRILKYRFVFNVYKFIKKKKFEYVDSIQHIVRQIEKKGYYVVNDFYTKEQCNLLKLEIDKMIQRRESNIGKGGVWEDKTKADERCFGAERDSEEIEKFYNDTFLLSVAENYFNGEMVNSNTLAARIRYKNNNLGSGDGWHRDAYNFQFKALVYLSDVEIKDGPFQMIEKSHTFQNILKDTICMNNDIGSSRYTSGQVDRVINENPRRFKKFTAKAGTLIFVDTSTIHAGMILKKGGERYTLFNYYLPSYYDVEKQTKVFLTAYQNQDE